MKSINQLIVLYSLAGYVSTNEDVVLLMFTKVLGSKSEEFSDLESF